MATNNATILDRIWLSGTNDFQQRIPQPTQQTIKSTMDALFDPMNKQYYNQFVDSLVMRIGMTFVHQQAWKNKLAAFKDSKMMYGATEQEIATKWVKAHAYRDDVEDVFKVSRPESAVWYHSQNRRDQYQITVDRQELMSAFTDEYGLNSYVASILQAPINADEYDEYRIMLQLLAFYEDTFGFYKHHLSGVPSDEATGKEFLKAVKAYTQKLTFPTTQYNGVRLPDLPVFARPDELVLFVTPEIAASVDVDTLAPLFHLDKADISARQIVVDEFPFKDSTCCAILTTRDFYRCRDTVYQTDSIYNPKTLGTNYFLNHWGIYSVSPFVPAIMFTTDAESSINVVTQSATGLNLTVDKAQAAAGDVVQLTAKLTGTLNNADGTGVVLAPDACTYSVTAMDKAGSGAVAIQLPSTTYVDEYARLHLSKSLKTGNVITVTAKSTYVNPSGTTTALTKTVTVTIA